MKVIYLLLIPFIIFSQTPDYPDTLYLKSGKVYPCIITQINDNFVKIIYKNHMQSSAALNAIDRLYMEQFQVIYSEGKYLTDTKLLNEFIANRNSTLKDIEVLPKISIQPEFDENKWSFGVLYVPYYFGIQNYIFFSSGYYYPQIYYITVGEFESTFESQFSYMVNPKLHFTFDMGWDIIQPMLKQGTKSMTIMVIVVLKKLKTCKYSCLTLA